VPPGRLRFFGRVMPAAAAVPANPWVPVKATRPSPHWGPLAAALALALLLLAAFAAGVAVAPGLKERVAPLVHAAPDPDDDGDLTIPEPRREYAI
jgi:hypothetical protein